MVLFIHANISSYVSGFDDRSAIGIYTQVITRILVDNAVPMFFLVSGFLFFLKRDTYINKWRKRSKSLLVPYLVWCFIGFLIPFVFQQILGLERFFSGNELKKIADFETTDYLRMFWDLRDGAPILSTMWFLRNLIVLTMLTPIIKLLVNKAGYFFPLILTIIYLCIPFNLPGISSTSLWWFGIGCWFSLGGGNLFSAIRNLSGLKVSIVWLISFVVILFSYYWDWQYELLHSIFMVVHLVGIYILLTFISSRYSLHLIKKISIASFFIYAVHEPWMGYLIGIIFKTLNPGGIVLYILPFVFVAFAVAFSYAVYLLMKRFSPSLLNMMTGARS